MQCERCGSLVTWRGPFSALTHTECESCGGINCQVVEPEPSECDGFDSKDMERRAEFEAEMRLDAFGPVRG